MNDPYFIDLTLRRGNEARDKVRHGLTDLSVHQLNWKPAPESWSIGQCMDHLVVSDSLYFPTLEKIADGSFRMNTWEKINPFSHFLGRVLVNQMTEKVTKKVKAPKVFVPSSSQLDPGIMDRFYKHLDTLLDYVSGFKRTDLDKTHITSPVSKVVTYSLRDALTILVNHEHRHVNQAMRVKDAKDFPGH